MSHGALTSYYPDGNKKTETDAEGNVTSYEYNAYGQVTKKVNPDGTVNLTEYDGLQREKATYFQSSESETKQILTQTAYEFTGHSFDIYTALNTASSHSYSGLKTVKTTYITADKQVFTETLTDRKENVVYEKINGETKRTSAYYANGQLARQTDALDNTTKYEYGFLNKVTKTYTPYNGKENYSITENQYDKNGNVIRTSQTVQEQNSDTAKYSVTENQYNAQNMLIQVTLSDGTANSEKNITKYFYNNAGVQTMMYTGLNSESDSDYMTTSYEYDRWARLVRTTDSTGYNSGTITYDLNGNALTTTDANGNVTTNTYDALNRVLTSETVSDDTSKNVSKSYTYDNMGRITNTTSNDLTTTYTYDELGRKSTESEYNNDGYSVFRGYFYEGVSQYVSQELTGQYHLLLYSDKTYEYDDEMRIIKVLESGNETASYTYDANGNKASETLANGVVSTYSYNNANRITKLVTKSGETTISEYEYSYYLDGSDSCKTRTENGIIETTSYEYDSLKRLTQETISKGSTVVDTYSYEYDDYGNRSKMTASGTADYTTVYDYNDADGNYTTLLQKEIKTVESEAETASASALASNPAELLNTVSSGSETEETVYSYDANGNQVTKTTSEKTEKYTYDALNQLVGFADGDIAASYAYNVSGLRIEKTVDGETINHVWDGSKQIVADIVDNDFYEADCYLRGTNLVAKYNYCNGVKSEYTYYTQNAHGDVVNLTDETGAVTKSYTYDAFGVEQNIDDSDTNAFRYCGEYFDAETGTVYLRARYYDPSIGRFISRDSYAGKNEDPLSLNRYTYCHNNPIYGVDPNGHFIISTLVLGIVVGALAGAAVSGGVSLYNEASAVGGISNMTSDNWGSVGKSALAGGIFGAIGGGAGAIGAVAAGSLVTASAASPLIASAASSTLSYAVGTGIAGGMAGGCVSTAAQQIHYGYYNPNEILQNTAWGGVGGGVGAAIGYGLANCNFGRSTSLINNRSTNQTTALANYDTQLAARQLLSGGKTSASALRSFVPSNVSNTFKPSSTITQGYRYDFRINNTRVQVKWHSSDLNAATLYPGCNSGNGWTAQVRIGHKYLTQAGTFTKRVDNYTHIPLS